MSLKSLVAGSLLFAFLPCCTSACELCAIYSANSASGGGSSGFLFTIAEQYTSSHTLQGEGHPFSSIPFLNGAFLDSSLTHFVPSYNFSPRLGISLNAPLVDHEFTRRLLLTTGGRTDESGSLVGLGDIALIGRLSLVQKVKMKYSINVNLLAGLKLPTGDTARLDDEVNSAKTDLALFGPGHPHGAIGGVHQHDLT